jgi:hypothetical protein
MRQLLEPLSQGEPTMRLTPDSLKVESWSTTDVPEKVGYASSDTRFMECSGMCVAPTCINQYC